MDHLLFLRRYAKYNLTDAPMKYSPELAKTAKAWANELLNACGVVGIEHEDYNPFGENCECYFISINISVSEFDDI
jgi:hypothetical protein